MRSADKTGESVAGAQFNRVVSERDRRNRDNNGKRPANLESLVEQRAEPQLNDLAEQFKGNIG